MRQHKGLIEGFFLGVVAVVIVGLLVNGFGGLLPASPFAFDLGAFGLGGTGFSDLEQYQAMQRELDDPQAAGRDPDATPDGRTIAYVTYGQAGDVLTLAGIDGGSIRPLVEAPDSDATLGGPDVSPDGTLIVYHVDPQSLADGSWSGDGDPRFLRAHPPRPDLYAVPPAGGTPTRITTAEGSGGIQPTWSPDGRTIAYTCHFARDGAADLCLIAPDGSGFRVLTDTPEIGEGQPTWSPDGTRLAFVAVGPETSSIDQLELATGARTTLFDDDHRGLADPAWSSDGRTIATTAGVLAGSGTVCVRPIGGGAAPCHEGAPGGEWASSWLPDGRVLFDGYVYAASYGFMWVMDPSTGAADWFDPRQGLRDLPGETS